ncbi:unnamed protein product [Adineta ricciae]|uniref:Uncharacterized protein n=1 Tax=Adineta ricciae TaxID=249248 RepID=A0A815NMN8_ADIRI|nr:unnamed protein product [Adineta ricciae]
MIVKIFGTDVNTYLTHAQIQQFTHQSHFHYHLISYIISSILILTYAYAIRARLRSNSILFWKLYYIMTVLNSISQCSPAMKIISPYYEVF